MYQRRYRGRGPTQGTEIVNKHSEPCAKCGVTVEAQTSIVRYESGEWHCYCTTHRYPHWPYAIAEGPIPATLNSNFVPRDAVRLIAESPDPYKFGYWSGGCYERHSTFEAYETLDGNALYVRHVGGPTSSSDFHPAVMIPEE